MRNNRRRIALCMLAAGALAAADLKTRIDEAIDGSPALSSAFIGAQVVSLADGTVLYERNAGHLFIPASNMKLFTSAMALMRLGSDYRFITRVVAERAIDGAGTLAGDLIFEGGGDPSISGRAYPYQKRAASDNTVAPLEALADQIVANGLRRIDGDIVGVDRRYLFAPYPDGWSVGDQAWEYGAPVSALIVNDNSVSLTVRPGENEGDPAQIQVWPPLELYAIDNRVRTETRAKRTIEVERTGHFHEVHLWGVIGLLDPGITEVLSVHDPAWYAAESLRDALVRRGVVVQGSAVARHRFDDDGFNPGRNTKEGVDKVSQNLHAEVMLREVGAVRRHAGTREAGLAEMRAFLLDAGVDKDGFYMTDGSGLSRSTLVSPAAVTTLLAHMYHSNYRDLWLNLLPVGGVDGTLGLRFEGHPEARGIVAKTGSLSHVRAMSGYAESPQYGKVAFSFLVNNFEAPSPEIGKTLDKLGLTLLH
jgi:serine-type D-Ala-D-Ala carboxypeptidase/endopeptidase (penicillin-binding protein 4)